MTTREQADELLEMGKRRAGLKELHGLADEHRDRPAYHAPITACSSGVRYATYTREYLGWGVFALMSR